MPRLRIVKRCILPTRRRYKLKNVKTSALLAFSLLAQAVVGELRWVMAFAEKRYLVGLAAVGVLLGLAIFTSLLHLGTPGDAYRAVRNWRTSWLSREIIALLVFVLVWAMSLVLYNQGLVGNLGSIGLELLNLPGLVLVYCMAQVYMLRTVPGWNTFGTFLSFYFTALLLGGVVFILIESPGDKKLRIAVVALFLLLILQIITNSLLVRKVQPEARHLAVFQIGMFLVALPALVWLLSAPISGWLYAVLALLVAAEILGRFAFYRHRLREGI